MIRGPAWEAYYYDVDGRARRSLVTFDLNAAREKVHPPSETGRRVIIGLVDARVLANGLPNEKELDAVLKIEEALVAALSQADIACRLVGTHTYTRRHELVFQVTDVIGFERAVLGVAFTIRPRPLDIESYEGWSYFDGKIRPRREAAMQISDRHVIDTLISRGCKRGTSVMIDHHFAGSVETLGTIKTALAADGYACTGEGEAFVSMSRSILLELDGVWSTTCALARQAQEAGARYEGWGATPPDPA